MQGIAATRLRLGLSQEMFAIELGVSRSMLSKAENGVRLLPTAALLKLAALEISITAGAPAKLQEQMSKPATGTATINQSLPLVTATRHSFITEAEKCKNKLDVLIARYKKVLLNMSQVELIMTGMVAENEKFAPGYLQLHRYKQLRKLKHCGPAAQDALRNKISLLYAAQALQAGNIISRETL